MKKNLHVLLLAGLSHFALQVIAQNTSPYWSLAGNANVSAATSKLGTTNATPVRFFTNNIERGRINTSGTWGIGDVGTDARLTVTGAAGVRAFRVRVGSDTKFVVQGNGGVSIGSLSAGPANGLFVVGNVGIGTAAPSQKLQVVGRGLFSAGLTVSDGGITATNTASSGNGVLGSGYYGVYGNGTNTGVYGKATNSTGSGVSGSGFIGVYATSSAASGDGIRTYAYGTSAYGINAYSGLSFGVYATTGTPSSYAGYFAGNVYSTGVYLGSDRKLKQDITDLSGAMAVISKLKPKSYTFRQDGAYKLMNLPQGEHYGLLAQDVEEVLPGIVKATTFEIAKATPNANMGAEATAVTGSEAIAFKALNYTELIPIVVKGMQELSDENKSLRAEVAELRQILLELKSGRSTITYNSASLEQNTPNPVSGTTTIRYTVPQTAAAKLTFTNAKGQIVRTISINNKGLGQVNFNTSSLPAGAYNYTLYVDGRQVDTKRLIIAK